MLDQLDTLIAFALIMLLLSLLITTFVQAFNVVLQRRGYNLLWGVGQVLEQMGIEKKKAKTIAEKILKDSALSPSRMLPVYASAIRVEELARLLGKVMADATVVCPADRTADWFQKAKEAASALIKVMSSDSKALATGLNEVGAETLGNQVWQLLPEAVRANVTAEGLEYAINTVCKALATDAAQPIESALQTIGTRVLAALPAPLAPPAPGATVTAEQLRNAIERTFATQMAQVRQQAADLKAWFDMVMDRTTERFVAWNRWVAVGASLVFCLVLQVDGLDILTKLHADKQLRATLVAQVDPTIKQAKEILELSSTGLGSRALTDLVDDLKAAGYADKVPADLDTRTKGQNWLEKNVKDPQKKDLIAKYEERFDALAGKRLDELGETRKELLRKLGDTQLQLFPTSGEFCPAAWWHDVTDHPRHLGGILMAWPLLSLGAPFWFNMLKNLSNLRPILASRVEQKPVEQSGTSG